MKEAVRLVIWDLDDTFWRGTVTEGGIQEYIQSNHDTVIELARRGIVSSICSKNDELVIWPILQARGIAEYFVFPSISWQPKGARLAALIETMKLRPASVMFIDDNAANRAEAAAAVPDLQIEDATFIAHMLRDRRFAGKDDAGLTRLAQYRLMETRKRHESRALGDNTAFLRSCDIRVRIEYDVLSHLDRAIELINRTNQLNYTKRRLPEDLAQARKILAAQTDSYDCQAGLVHVVDAYGDYGFVGFYMLRRRRQNDAHGIAVPALEHYCFSCRTLGMQVERWLYEWLGRPAIKLAAEAPADLHDTTPIDWIRLTSIASEQVAGVARIAPEIRVHGGCEANAVGHYLGAYTDKISVTGNFSSGRIFLRVNSASLLLSACDRHGAAFEREAEALGLPYEMLVSRYFDDCPQGTVLVFSGGLDARSGRGGRRYQHRSQRWELMPLPIGLPFLNLVTTPLDQLETQLAAHGHDAGADDRFIATLRHLRANYVEIPGPDLAEARSAMIRLLARVPEGCKFIVMLDDPRIRSDKGTLAAAPWVTHYNQEIRAAIAEYPFAATVEFADFIGGEDEILIGGNHYSRTVYLRAAEAIVAAASSLPCRTATRLESDKLPVTQRHAATPPPRRDALRARNIEVSIDHDVLPHIERIMDLLSADHQQNITKRITTPDRSKLRLNLETQLRRFNCQAGLINVRNDIHEYRHAAFYMVTNGRRSDVDGAAWKSLVHGCVAGELDGLYIAEWLYEWLGRPEITPDRRGAAPIDAGVEVDWIRISPQGLADKVTPPTIAELRVHGSSEALAVGHYLRAICPAVTVSGSFDIDGLMVRANSAPMLLNACDRGGAAFEREAAALGVPYARMVSRYFDAAPENTVLVFSGTLDAAPRSRIFRHTREGWLINILPIGLPTLDIGSATHDAIDSSIAGLNVAPSLQARLRALVSHIRQNYEPLPRLDGAALQRAMRALFDRVPPDCMLVIVLDDARIRGPDGEIRSAGWITDYNDTVRAVAAGLPFVGVVSLTDAIMSESEIQAGGNHADPAVYFRLARLVAQESGRLQPRRLAANNLAAVG